MDFYLLEFRLKGIKNIEKEIAINFYKQDIRKFNRENYNVKGIFGRNGIGKTAIIKGIEILRNIVLDSDYLILKSSLLNEIINKKLKECYLSSEFLIIDKNNKNIIFITSKDDILTTESDLDYINKTFNNRVIIPYGGHTGILWHRDVVNLMVDKLEEE